MRLLAIALALIAASSQASDLEACRTANRNGSAGEVGCYKGENARLQKRLEQVVAKKIRGLQFTESFKGEGWSEQQVAALRLAFSRSQTHWEKYRDHYCEYQGRSVNGTGADLAALSCYLNLTSQRVTELEQ